LGQFEEKNCMVLKVDWTVCRRISSFVGVRICIGANERKTQQDRQGGRKGIGKIYLRQDIGKKRSEKENRRFTE